ncbi:Mediator of RNA polymerase II transcription subunit 13 [Wickerhamomyces ciferrii]|uniref:Mediator of RNA polymerase II transcription subunit 13 n=1 Tax=Wickerhamomyces ciferrii (strain ATCC 14091 / BCRC 22168 / CBS 111 / JCM 3599 / NBRC 0793 / NRRL Y-1031 F-60-10) TaxID=1206466 RepID=K0KD64_WICCF|nr:Mediator of RNA polymerase II transcription subunit 13 [Wickerhamomyces ciferrii]CCH40831.1 Mediator of RNA polymerase II transcription subunit 13 [Wickerhamomyces ciferrii]
MGSEIEASKILTNFVKLANTPEIKYTVFTPQSGQDQSILNAEIALRKNNPKILAVLFSKELWTFSITTQDPPSPDEKFGLNSSQTKTFLSSSIYGSSEKNPSSLLPLTYVTFLKALRKLLIVNLSYRGEIIPFGNAGILPDYKLLQLEPKLADCGDLLLSITSRNHNFIRLSEISDINSTTKKIDEEYATYLAPSGIRAYLANGNIKDSITTNPSNQDSILDTLFALHSIKLDPGSITWIKMIPNLGHLNAITSQISDYLKPVANSKYLVWPLELCFSQKSNQLSNHTKDRLSQLNQDPFSLIDDFANLRATSNVKTPSNIPTANNTPVNHTESPATTSDAFNLQRAQSDELKLQKSTSPPQAHQQQQQQSQSADINDSTNEGQQDNWSDLDDDLFGDGDGDGVTDADFNFFDNDGEEDPLADDKLEQELDQVLEETNNGLDIDSDEGELDKKDEHITSEDPEILENKFDIPIEEMTLPTSPLYTDPGAPEPVQSPKAARKRSIFSPLNFNPIIRSSVDNKYATGGKFFVSNVETPKGEDGTPPIIPSNAIDDDDDEDEDDDDDEDEDDDDVEEDEDEESEDDDKMEDDSSVTLKHSIDEDGNQLLDTGTNNTSSMVSPGDGIPLIKDSKLNSAEPEFKKLKLESTPVISLDDNDPSKDNRIPSPGVGGVNGSPNCIPFLLRAIPLHSIPSKFYSDSPKIRREEISKLIDTLLNQIVWDNNSLIESIPKIETNNEEFPQSIHRALAQTFPDIHEANLAELSGINEAQLKDYNHHHHESNLQAESPLSSFKNPEYVLSSTTPGNDSLDFPASPALTKDNETKLIDDKIFFQIPEPKLNVKRLNQIIKTNSSALFLWNSMSFSPPSIQKDFRTLILSPNTIMNESLTFINDIGEIYEKSQLGHVERINFGIFNNSVVSVDYNDDKFEENAISISKSLNEQWVKGSNYKNVVIFLIDFKQDLNSVINLCKIFQSMKEKMLSLPNNRSLPINVILKIIPSHYISEGGAFSILSINKLTKLSLLLYNSVGDQNETFTSISKQLPSKISFQLTKDQVSDKILSQDTFIHLAYGRSIDKEWCAAAWTDQVGGLRKTKAWHSPSTVKNSLETVTNEIWDITVKLSRKMAGKKYLVLTRIDGMIPDDELLQWKRLSSSFRELSLIVVSVNEDSQLLLSLYDPSYPFDKLFSQEPSFAQAGSVKLEAANTVGSSTGLTPSTIFTPQAVNSPDLFTLSSRPATQDSPSDFRINPDDSNTVVNIADKFHALILNNPNTLANSPTRLSIKTGFLIKPLPNSENKLASFEVNVLSCPGTLSISEFMEDLLTQYRNLATIGELFGVVGSEKSWIPWHIAAVEKSLGCLLHICVEKE